MIKPYFETELGKFYHGDCLKVMPLFDNKVDMVLTDPPYGITACKWDTIIPLEPMWVQLKRIIKDNGVVVLFGSEPFSSYLRMSNIKNFKYDWIWEKSKGCNFFHAKNMPIKFHEIISIFSFAKIKHKVQLEENRMNYNPQGLIKVDKNWSRPRKYTSEHRLKRESNKLKRVIEFENYPKSIIKIGNSNNQERGQHESQKPVALMEYLIKTYTNENETVLDFAIGSGTTAIACEKLNRRWIGIELSKDYCDTVIKRIKDITKINKLF